MGYLEEQEEHFKKLEEDETYISYFITFALTHLRVQPKKTKQVLEKVVEIAEAHNYHTAKAEALLYLSWCYHDVGEIKTSVELGLEAYELFTKVHNEQGIAKTCNVLLPNYTKMGMVDIGIEYGLKGIEIAERLQSSKLLSVLILNTNSAYQEIGDYDLAFEMLMRVKKFESELDDSALSNLYFALTEIYLYQDKLEEAEACCKELMTRIHKISYNFAIGDLMNKMGQLYFKKGNYTYSGECFKKAIKYTKRHKQPMILIDTLLNYAQFLISTGKYEQAIDWIKEGIEVAGTAHMDYELKKLYKVLSEAYKAMKQYEKALEAGEKYVEYEKRIFKLSSNLAFAKLNYKALELKAEMYETLYNKTEIISRVGKQLTANLNTEKIIEIAKSEISKVLKTDLFAIGLYDAESSILEYDMLVKDKCFKEKIEIELDEPKSLASYCLKYKVELFMNEAQVEYKKYIHEIKKSRQVGIGKVQSLMYCPLIVENHLIGVITVQSYHVHAYDENTFNALKILASYISIAIWNANLYEKVKYLANYDDLTKILNRREVLRRAEKYFELPRECHQVFAIIMLDIDHFKKINDTYGHIEGDKVIQYVASTLKKSIKEDQLVGRYGGEEFIVCMPYIRKGEAYLLAEHMRKTVMEKNLTVSFGIYEFRDNNVPFYQGLKWADEALYHAKETGRNQTVCYNELVEEIEKALL